MYISILSVSLLVSLAAAQSSTNAFVPLSTACAAENVFQSCLDSTNSDLTAYCTSTTDYGCLCSRWNDVLNCYKLCPNDPGKAGVESSVAAYCADASAYGTTTAATATPISATVSTAASQTNAGTVQGTSSTPTGTSTAASATKSGAAARGLAISAGGVMVGLAGVLGFFL